MQGAIFHGMHVVVCNIIAQKSAEKQMHSWVLQGFSLSIPTNNATTSLKNTTAVFFER